MVLVWIPRTTSIFARDTPNGAILASAQSTMPVTRQLVFISLDITPENTKVREKGKFRMDTCL